MAEAGLELPIGITEQKFLQQLARIEAKAIKTSNAMAKKFANDNKAIGGSFKSAADSADVFTRELDAMRSKFDPVYAASKRYEDALDELNRAHKLGVLNAKQYEVALERLGQEMLTVNRAGVAAGNGFTVMGRSLSGAATSNLQNVSYQLQDIFVQISSGQGVTRALGQQLPQLASGFGVVGSAIGLAAAVAIPLAGALLNTRDNSELLEETIRDLTDSVDAYKDAVSRANSPTEELIEKYGRASGAAQQLLTQLAAIAQVEAGQALRKSVNDIAESFEGLEDRVARFNQVLAQGYGADEPAAVRQVRKIREEYGLTIEQAQELVGILSDQSAAETVEQQADAMRRLASFLNEAARESGYTSDALIDAARAASEGALSGYELEQALKAAATESGNVRDAIASIDFSNPIGAAEDLRVIMGGMVGQAQSLVSFLGAAAQAANKRLRDAVATNNELDPLGAFNGNGRAFGDSVQIGFGGNLQAPVIPDLPTTSSGGGRRSGGGGGRSSGGSGREEAPFFGDLERDLEQLQRQIDLVGKSSEEVATLRAKWELLDEAKRRGLAINDELNAKIDAQSASVGRLTAELERGEIAQEQFETAIDGIADSMSQALIAGESLREGLAQVFAGIASDLLNSGIRQALGGMFGGGGFNVGSLFGGLPSFDGGGFTGYGSRSGGIDGRGGYPAILHPNETVVDHTKGQAAGGGGVDVRVTMDQNGNLQAYVENISGNVTAKAVASNNKTLPSRVQNINRNPRKR